MNVADRAALELYREAKLDPNDAAGAAEVAAGVLGDGCIRFVPGTALPGRAELARVKGEWRIYVRRGLATEHMHHAIGHELGHLWMRRQGLRWDDEDLADQIGAAVCAPRAAYLAALTRLGPRFRQLGRLFVMHPGAAALRIAECTGEPAALVSRRRVRTRGNPWPWPSDAELRRRADVRGPGVVKVDQTRRLVWASLAAGDAAVMGATAAARSAANTRR